MRASIERSVNIPIEKAKHSFASEGQDVVASCDGSKLLAVDGVSTGAALIGPPPSMGHNSQPGLASSASTRWGGTVMNIKPSTINGLVSISVSEVVYWRIHSKRKFDAFAMVILLLGPNRCSS
jgi:hypothetical protein